MHSNATCTPHRRCWRLRAALITTRSPLELVRVAMIADGELGLSPVPTQRQGQRIALICSVPERQRHEHQAVAETTRDDEYTAVRARHLCLQCVGRERCRGRHDELDASLARPVS